MLDGLTQGVKWSFNVPPGNGLILAFYGRSASSHFEVTAAKSNDISFEIAKGG
jgi:hypothetical protein